MATTNKWISITSSLAGDWRPILGCAMIPMINTYEAMRDNLLSINSSSGNCVYLRL
jgi:hypothetical protein